jgi:hypothetical protein
MTQVTYVFIHAYKSQCATLYTVYPPDHWKVYWVS